MSTEVLRVWTTLLLTIAVIFQGVYLHELGHALTGRAFGLEPRIELTALGGLTWWKAGGSLSPWRRILISAAGPAVGLILGAPALLADALLEPADPILAYTLWLFWWVNFGWAIFNLLPMMPLDGGNIMSAFFELISPRKGRRYARYASMAVIGAILLIALGFEQYFLAAFMAFFGFGNYQGARAELALERRTETLTRRADARSEEDPLLRAAYAALEVGDGQAVLAVATQLIESASDETRRDEGWHLLAWGHFLLEEISEARAALDAMSGERDPDPGLEGAIELRLGDAEVARELLWQSILLGHGGSFVEERFADATAKSASWAAVLETLRAEEEVSLEPFTLARLQASAFFAGEHALALGFGERLWGLTGSALAAFNNACSLARMGDAERAFEWLDRSIEAGLDDVKLLDEDEDLEALRSDPRWEPLRATLEE